MHHPSYDLLVAFNQHRLSNALSIAVAAHLELCSCCSQKQKRSLLLNQGVSLDSLNDDDSIANTLHACLESQQIADFPYLEKHDNPQMAKFFRHKFELPQALNYLPLKPVEQLEHFECIRAKTTANAPDVALLHIKAGTQFPKHKHTGYELCVVLSGSYKDELGDHCMGDFSYLSKSSYHAPFFKQDCLCLLITEDKSVIGPEQSFFR